MFTTKFWKQSAERAGKSSAQVLIGAWSGDTLFNLWEVDWTLSSGVAAGAAALSLLTSMASLRVGEAGTPDLTR